MKKSRIRTSIFSAIGLCLLSPTLQAATRLSRFGAGARPSLRASAPSRRLSLPALPRSAAGPPALALSAPAREPAPIAEPASPSPAPVAEVPAELDEKAPPIARAREYFRSRGIPAVQVSYEPGYWSQGADAYDPGYAVSPSVIVRFEDLDAYRLWRDWLPWRIGEMSVSVNEKQRIAEANRWESGDWPTPKQRAEWFFRARDIPVASMRYQGDDVIVVLKDLDNYLRWRALLPRQIRRDIFLEPFSIRADPSQEKAAREALSAAARAERAQRHLRWRIALLRKLGLINADAVFREPDSR